MREKILELHGKGTLKRSALGLPGGEAVFERVLSGNGYRTVLEIGTYRGCSAAAMSRYCERVVTIDLRYGQMEQTTSPAFDRRAFWDSLGAHNISLRLIDDDEEKAALISLLDFDFAFLDGAHNDCGVRLDFELVRRCGRVLFHDYTLDGLPGHNFVSDLVHELPADEVQVMGVFALWEAKR